MNKSPVTVKEGRGCAAFVDERQARVAVVQDDVEYPRCRAGRDGSG